MDLIRILSICKILLVLNRSIIDISISENNIKVDFPCYSNFLKHIYSKELPHSSTKSCQVGQEELSPWPEQSLKNKTFKDLQGHSNFKSYRSEDGDEKTFIQHFRISFKNIYHTKFYYDSFGSTNGFIEKKIKTSKYQRNQDGHGPSDLIISEQLSSINIGNLIPELSDLFRCIVFVFLALTTSYLFKRYFLKHVNVDNVDTIDSELSEKESSIRTLNKCRHDTVNSEVNPVPFVETESETLVNEDDSPTIDLSSEEKNRLEIKNPEKHDTGELIHDRREPYVVKNDCLDSVRISEIRDIDAMVQNKCEKFPIENVCLVNNHALTTLSFFTKHDEAHSNDRSQGSTELLNETENRNVVDVPSEENVHNEENGLLNRTTDKCTTDTISCLISSKQEKRKLDKNDFFENECHCKIKSEGVQIPKSELFYATDGKDYDSELKKKADFNAMPIDVTDKECILKHKHNCDEVTLKTKKQIVDVDSSERSVDLSQIVVFLDFPSKTNLSYQNPFSKFPHAGKSYFKSPSTTIDLQQIKRSLFTCLLKKILLDTFKSMTSDLASNRTRIVDNVTTGSFSDHSLKIVLDLQTDGKDDDGDFSIDIKEFHSLKETRVNRDECLTQPYRSYLKLPRLSKRIVNNVEKRNMFDDIKSVCENILKSKDRNLPTLQEVEAMISKNKSRDLCLEDSFRKKHSEFHNHELGFDYSIARRWYRLPIIQKICQVNTLTINERIETFRFWPSDAAVSKIDLVEAGFIYKGDGYEVECDTCHLVKSDWSLDDEPLIIHKKLKPDCEFLKTTFPDLQVPINRNETDNAYQVEGHQSLVNQMDSMSIRNHASQNELNLPLNLPTNVKNEETQRNMGSQISFITAPQQQPLFDGAFTSMNPSTLFPPGATALPANDGLSIAGVPPRHPDFATIQQRIWTFRPWPYGHIQDPVYLVDAG
ncbi:hypothetical protein KUTeg_007317 [Tegillarca granosa]|uniref:Uncharacterized protein n=1 Tax=Tegillarca granosa TaxID=220873 RepID=A0ABQ9FF82_TEGGR|nr:hypothetical protein KUTeg_007317 [Tegillarca granosa]